MSTLPIAIFQHSTGSSSQHNKTGREYKKHVDRKAKDKMISIEERTRTTIKSLKKTTLEL